MRDKPGTNLPRRIIPHFHEETKAYLRANPEALDRSSTVPAKVLKGANWPVSRVRLQVPEAQANVGSARLRAATFARATHQRYEVRRQVFHASAATNEQASGRNAPEALSSGAELVNHKPQSIQSQNLNTTILVLPGCFTGYDGLRSFPHLSAIAHNWKLYTGPFSTQ
ncbi:hypothetical protein VTH82DRAFT_2839 [Thermothelomyces myriococcoides]